MQIESITFGQDEIRATSHPFAHAKSAIRWLQWLLRNLSNVKQYKFRDNFEPHLG
jgi:hypothetical protein